MKPQQNSRKTVLKLFRFSFHFSVRADTLTYTVSRKKLHMEIWCQLMCQRNFFTLYACHPSLL